MKRCIAAKRAEVFGVIFYWHNVVGGGVNCTNDIYGGGIHMNPPLQRVHMHIQLQQYAHAARNGDRFFIHRAEILISS